MQIYFRNIIYFKLFNEKTMSIFAKGTFITFVLIIIQRQMIGVMNGIFILSILFYISQYYN